jgi:hypothetical protein
MRTKPYYQRIFCNGSGENILRIGVTRNYFPQDKLQTVPHLKPFTQLTYENRGYDGKTFYIPTFVQIFWWKLTFFVEVFPKKIGEGRYLREIDVLKKQEDAKTMMKPMQITPEEHADAKLKSNLAKLNRQFPSGK